MPMHTLPNIGLQGGFLLGEDGWDDEVNSNWLRLSALCQLRVINRIPTASIPGSPSQGDMYIITDGANANKIAVRDDGAWTYITPTTGWRAWDATLNGLVIFNGTSWAPFSLGMSGVTANVLSYGAGSYTYTKHADALWIEGFMVGGGGNGGAGNAGGGNGQGGGGGSGAFGHFWVNASALPSTVAITVGAVGGTTSFGSYISCTGGGNGTAGSNTATDRVPGGTPGAITTSAFPGYCYPVNGQGGQDGCFNAPSGDGGGTPLAPGSRSRGTNLIVGVAAPAFSGAGGSGGRGTVSYAGGTGSTGFMKLIEYRKV